MMALATCTMTRETKKVNKRDEMHVAKKHFVPKFQRGIWNSIIEKKLITANRQLVTTTFRGFPSLTQLQTIKHQLTYIGVTRGAVLVAITRREAIVIGVQRRSAKLKTISL
jgi:hypothetical protein